MGGFECSSHRRRDGRRLDMIAATGHERSARLDYACLAEIDIRTARDGLRWHLIESSPGKFDFSSVSEQMDAAQTAGVEVIWDLFHYGYPDDLDIFADEFPKRLGDLASNFAEHHLRVTGQPPRVIPVNEISFFSWIAGDIGHFYPFAIGRGDELKRRLGAAAIAAARAVKSVTPDALVIASEPLIHVSARRESPELEKDAECYRLSQFQAFDILTGSLASELGGGSDCLDVLGINYYPHNQWYYPDREMIPVDSMDYRPLRELLCEVTERYQLPILISETGTEGNERVSWFKYVSEECRAASGSGVDLRGMCLYPIVNHPGWEDERHCHNGLWDYCNEHGSRKIYEPLASEVNDYIHAEARSAAERNLEKPPLKPVQTF